MPTVAEILKSAGIAEDVASGLPKEVVTALTGYVAEADTKYATATEAERQAEEARRQAELERKQINEYVSNYGTSLTEMASVKAKNDAQTAYLKSLKDQGFTVPDDLVAAPPPAAKPVVPGSPAEGGNKEVRILADVTAQFLDANNEHIRLFGQPIPESSFALMEEANRARKPVGQYISEKFKFRDKQTENERKSFEAKVKAEVDRLDEERKKKFAEEHSSNPNLRRGESSQNSFVPKIKPDEFHKSDGNVPVRQRHNRMLEKIHQEVAAQQNA